MARDHARIRLDIWADEDWRDLPSIAQWLYLHLLSSPSLSFCGVTDWRPARIAALAAELKGDDVEYAANWLEEGQFIIVDRGTEEVLIRSWVKHDGLVSSPNMTKAMAKAHATIGSGILRAVVVDQLERLKIARPELHGWKHLGDILRKRSLTVTEAFRMLPPNPSANPSPNPSDNPSDEQSGNGSENRRQLRTPFSVLHSPDSDPSSDQISHLTRAQEDER